MPSSAPSTETRTLLQPIKVGSIQLGHGIAMAPMTRFISPASGGLPNVPGIYNDAQITSWKKIVDAVHSKGGKMIMQLGHLGRAASADLLKAQGGFDVVSASDIPFEGGAVPRPMTVEEIAATIQDFAQGAKNFINGSGGDGVELHAASGYLIDQFLQTTSNKRTDNYGGSVENRVRFGLEAVKALVDAVGADKVGLKLTPYSEFQGMKMEAASIAETFAYFVTALKTAHPNLAYIHVVESRVVGHDTVDAPEGEKVDFLYKIWTPSAFLVAGGYDTPTAFAEAEKRVNTVVVFGRHFISNPDLVDRIRHNHEYTPYNRATFYMLGPENVEGYTNYKNFPAVSL